MAEDEAVELLMRSAEEQRAIICSLESDTSDESLYVYTVSQAWYDRWRAYVGLDQPAQPCLEAASNDTGQRRTPSQDAAASNATSEVSETEATTLATAAETNSKPAPAPGPIEMDLTDEDNISVDEKVMSR